MVDKNKEGTEVTPDTLMLKAIKRYQSLTNVGQSKSVWPENKRIIALITQIEKM